MRIIDGAAVLLVCALLLGCGSRDGEEVKTASTPAEAASQIERAFADAPEETRRAADMAAEALRRGEFEKAVVSLTTVRAATNVTFEQGLAIHGSTLQLEARLAAEIATGSESAQRAATNVTFEQGLAIHGSTLQLEARLAAEIATGSESAQRAYGLLKAMKAK